MSKIRYLLNYSFIDDLGYFSLIIFFLIALFSLFLSLVKLPSSSISDLYISLTSGIGTLPSASSGSYNVSGVYNILNVSSTDNLTQKTLTSPDINTPDIDGGSIDACTIGTNSVVTDLRVDNLKMDGNTISSTNTNGPIDYDTNGSGNHVFKVGTTTALTISLSGGNTTITGP